MLFWFIVILFAGSMIYLFASWPRMGDYEVFVAGTHGLPFSGSIRTEFSDGTYESRSVAGIVPAVFRVKAVAVSVSFQKDAREGSLRVEIRRKGEVASRYCTETEAAFGCVRLGRR